MTPSSPPFTPFQSCHVVKFDWPSDFKSSPWEINLSCLSDAGAVWSNYYIDYWKWYENWGKLLKPCLTSHVLLNICYLSSKYIVYDIVVCIYCVASGCFLQRYSMWVCMNPLKHKQHIIYTSHQCFSRSYVFTASFDCSGPSKTQTKKVACRCAAIQNHHHVQQ